MITTFSPVQFCHPVEGGLWSGGGGGGEAYNRMDFFCFKVARPITGEGGGGGGAYYNQNFTVSLL